MTADLPAASAAPWRQRLDKWLWFARIVKSRTLAAKLVVEGRVRVNAARVDNPAKPVCAGDVLTIALEREVKVLKIIAAADRRNAYAQARLLYDDMSVSRAVIDPMPNGPRIRG